MDTLRQQGRFPVWAALIPNLIFYLGFVLVDGPVICVDTPSYLSMDYSREPLYPLLLASLRRLFGSEWSVYGSETYLIPAVILQAILMAVCVWYTARVCGEILEPVMGWRIGVLLANLVLWGVDLLNRFAASRGSMYVECIMTESLCIPLFYVFIVKAWRYFAQHRRQDLLWLFSLMLVMTCIRKQSMVTMVILCGFAFLYDLLIRRNWSSLVACVLGSIVVLVLMTGCDYAYNYALRGVWMHKTDNYKGGACTLLYTATAEDAALFEDDETRALYEEVYRQMTEQGLTYDSIPADSDWITRSDHYADAYDVIGYDVLVPVLQAHVLENEPGIDDTHKWIAIDGYMQTFQNTLLRGELLGSDRGRLVSTWLASYANGFCNTVLRKSPRLTLAVVLLYLLYLVGWIRMLWSDKGPLALFAGLVLFSIVVNVVVVGSMIFAQTRYMIYNMGFFYIALIGMAAAILRRRKAS